MKNYLLKTMLITLVIFTSCDKKKEKVGGACDYVKVEKNVIATFINGTTEGDFTVSFQPQKEKDSDEVYRIEKKQFLSIKNNFDLNELNNKNNVYTLKIEEITKGTCTPIVLKELILIK